MQHMGSGDEHFLSHDIQAMIAIPPFVSANKSILHPLIIYFNDINFTVSHNLNIARSKAYYLKLILIVVKVCSGYNLAAKSATCYVLSFLPYLIIHHQHTLIPFIFILPSLSQLPFISGTRIYSKFSLGVCFSHSNN